VCAYNAKKRYDIYKKVIEGEGEGRPRGFEHQQKGEWRAGIRTH
jgi:hypothetical protein